MATINELEDQPEDVQNATPVEMEVKNGEIDELSSPKGAKQTAETKNETTPRHRCQIEKPPTEKVDCCEMKRRHLEEEQNRKVTVYVHGKPCELVKHDIIPRHCFTKDEYLQFLAKPKEKCPSDCTKKAVKRRFRVMSPRIEELAKPMGRRLRHTLEEKSEILSAEMRNNLVEILEGETALTAEQAENLVRDCRASKKPPKAKKRKIKCPPPAKPCPPVYEAGDPIDPEVADHQYSMSKLFVCSILNYKCPIPREEYEDIADTILEMLSQELEYVPVGNEDRKSRQMRILSDGFACWMSGILLRISEKHKAELEAECLKKRKEMEEAAMREAMMAEDADDEQESDDDYDKINDNDDDDDELLSKTESVAKSTMLEEEAEKDTQTMKTEVSTALEDSGTQYEQEEADLAAVPSKSHLGTEFDDESLEEMSINDDASHVQVEEEGIDQEQQTETEVKVDVDTDTQEIVGAPSYASGKSPEQEELDKIASRISKAFETDVPFITFAKLADTLYTMLETYCENELCDPINNRIHRAIYEKISEAINREDPTLLTERTRDVVDVISGKITSWLRNTLNDQQIKFLKEETPAKIESKEVREWSGWLENLTDQAEVWCKWIEKVTNEAQNMKKKGKVTRGAWQKWTCDVETNALRWRETYLKAAHQQHFNTMMMAERKVLKTGTKIKTPYVEKTIKNINFESPSRF